MIYERGPNLGILFGDVPFAIYKKGTPGPERSVFVSEHTLVFVLEGRKQLHIAQEVIEVGSDKIILLKRGLHVMSEVLSEQSEYQCVMIFISDEFIRRFLSGVDVGGEKFRQAPDHLVLPSSELLDNYKSLYVHYFGQQLETLRQVLDLKLQEFFLLLMGSAQRSEVIDFLQNAVDHAPMDLEFIMRRHLLQPLTLENLARLSGRSLSKFKRDFEKGFGCSPRKWIIHERLVHAGMLVAATDSSIAEIAYDCGFENVSHFISLYKRHFGATPRVHRAEIGTN
jgi:AraC-like DNA-binding protein